MAVGGIKRGTTRLEQLVRPFALALSPPIKVREPKTPDLVHPEAYIEWGAASQFANDFRSDAQNVGFSTAARITHPLYGEMREEGRRWEDFAISNPEDSGQKIIITRTSEVALRTLDHPPPQAQVRFVFSNTGAEQPPGYRNSKGEDFQPVVLSPLETITDVSWGGYYVIISALLENRLPFFDMVLTLKKPPTGEDSNGSSQWLGNVASGGHQKESTESDPGGLVIHHPKEWAFEGQGTANFNEIPDYKWHVSNPPGEDHVYGNGILLYDTELIPNPSHPSLAAQDFGHTWGRHVPDSLYGTLVKNVVVDIDIGGAIYGRARDLLAKPMCSYSRQYSYSPSPESQPQSRVITRKIYAYRMVYDAWDEHYHPPWAYVACAIDISGLFKHYVDYYLDGQPISVGVTIVAGAPPKDYQPSCKVRWALYRGRIDGPDSVAKKLSDFPFDEDTVSTDAIWAWLLAPDDKSADVLMGSAEEGVPAGDGTLDDYNKEQVTFLWDFVNRMVPGVRPMFI